MWERTRKAVEIGIGLRLLGLLQLVYEKSDGRFGQHLGGLRLLLLRTRGRRSGRPRTVELLYVPDGDYLLIVGSKGGSDRPPAWLVNLLAEPLAEVQIGRERREVRARLASEAEYPRVWALVNRAWNYDAYQARTARRIPVVILEQIGSV